MMWPSQTLEKNLCRWVKQHPVTRTPCAEYQYAPLRADGKQSVRLLFLLPASSLDKHLVCYLIETPMRDFESEVLSYAWGEPIHTKSILCVFPGQEHYTRLSITQNLDQALRRLRRKRRFRPIWVDALCINQQDNVEKIRQISLMAEIYSKASQTIIWLGEKQPMAGRLFVLYRVYNSMARFDQKVSNFLEYTALDLVGESSKPFAEQFLRS